MTSKYGHGCAHIHHAHAPTLAWPTVPEFVQEAVQGAECARLVHLSPRLHAHIKHPHIVTEVGAALTETAIDEYGLIFEIHTAVVPSLGRHRTHLDTQLDVTTSLQSSRMPDDPARSLTWPVEVARTAQVVGPDIVVEEPNRDGGLVARAAQRLLLFLREVLVGLVVTCNHGLVLIRREFDSSSDLLDIVGSRDVYLLTLIAAPPKHDQVVASQHQGVAASRARRQVLVGRLCLGPLLTPQLIGASCEERVVPLTPGLGAHSNVQKHEQALEG
mmetsp:Transcript_12778/g.20831  ORF Transcript_12778/g.20831 Transcript_12778/m.20831 type:complete len:273 (-) Transcript_12778:71-889(-)